MSDHRPAALTAWLLQGLVLPPTARLPPQHHEAHSDGRHEDYRHQQQDRPEFPARRFVSRNDHTITCSRSAAKTPFTVRHRLR
jgi:hypothetical protein